MTYTITRGSYVASRLGLTLMSHQDLHAQVGALAATLPRDVVQKLWEIASDPPDECAEHLNDVHMLFQAHFADFSILMDHSLELVARFRPIDGVAKEVRASSFGAAYAHAASGGGALST